MHTLKPLAPLAIMTTEQSIGTRLPLDHRWVIIQFRPTREQPEKPMLWVAVPGFPPPRHASSLDQFYMEALEGLQDRAIREYMEQALADDPERHTTGDWMLPPVLATISGMVCYARARRTRNQPII